MDKIVLLLTLLSVFTQSYCLQCYHCNTTFPTPSDTEDFPNCVYAKAQNETIGEFGQLSDCEEPENATDGSQALCMLSISDSGSEKFHLRSCVTGPLSLSGKCFDKDEGKRRLCYCTTDECNANLESAKLHNIANQMDVSFIVTIIVSIFSFYFF